MRGKGDQARGQHVTAADHQTVMNAGVTGIVNVVLVHPRARLFAVAVLSFVPPFATLW
jgi:hypothetical protein